MPVYNVLPFFVFEQPVLDGSYTLSGLSALLIPSRPRVCTPVIRTFLFFFFLWIRRPPRSPLFPSPPLFRPPLLHSRPRPGGIPQAPPPQARHHPRLCRPTRRTISLLSILAASSS